MNKDEQTKKNITPTELKLLIKDFNKVTITSKVRMTRTSQELLNDYNKLTGNDFELTKAPLTVKEVRLLCKNTIPAIKTRYEGVTKSGTAIMKYYTKSILLSKLEQQKNITFVEFDPETYTKENNKIEVGERITYRVTRPKTPISDDLLVNL